MLETLQFIGQDAPHFLGTVLLILVIAFGLAMIIASTGFAIALARGMPSSDDDTDRY